MTAEQLKILTYHKDMLKFTNNSI